MVHLGKLYRHSARRTAQPNTSILHDFVTIVKVVRFDNINLKEYNNGVFRFPGVRKDPSLNPRRKINHGMKPIQKRVFCALVVMLLAALLLPAAAEEDVPLSTPTDLCPHENTETVYYFDAPIYRPLDEATHLVTGRATVEEHCVDCGTVLSVTVEDDAEEVKDHIFRRGQCVLCGFEGGPAPVVQEVVRTVDPDEENENRFFCVFTVSDLENAGDILVLRAGEYRPAVALQTQKLVSRMDRGDTLSVEMLVKDGNTVTVSVHITAENGKVNAPDGEFLSLRFYGGKADDPITVRWTNMEDEKDTAEQQASWVDGGNGGYYMAFPYLGDGTYKY